MSPAQNKNPQPSKSTSASDASMQTQAHASSEPPASAEPIVEPTMDQQPNTPLIAIPPKRPVPPDPAISEPAPSEAVTPAPEVHDVATPASDPSPSTEPVPEAVAESSEASANRLQPIPPASEPMQYRAIGLVRGRYVPSDEQFTRGFILTEEEVQIDAVLLGRVMSLVKKHLDLEQPHLWVVYPRTREKTNDLHMQIVGVWEPEKLSRDESMLEGEETDAADTQPSEPLADELSVPASELDDKYFSVRGEVIFQAAEEDRLLVKIRRVSRQEPDKDKAFKVALRGKLEGRAVGYFWDLQVERQDNELVIREGTLIGAVPPQKRKGEKPRGRFQRGPGGGGRGPAGAGPRRWNAGSREGSGPRPHPRTDRPVSDRPVSDRPSVPRPEAAKPIKRRPPQGGSAPGDA